ncbi:hypothetical protein FRC10_004673 [Ceratobasidium sp. 414]|nr:hypothetical protein FRC10_004673 [Ceratobasidium sp. 414]
MSSQSRTVVRRTYGSRTTRARDTLSFSDASISSDVSSPPRATVSSPLPEVPRASSATLLARKRPPGADLRSFFETERSTKKLKSSSSSRRGSAATTSNSESFAAPAPALTQLHFITSKPIMVTCKLCDLSYTRGAPEDEELHRAHCLRVIRGMEWSREERALERPIGLGAAEVELVEERCLLSDGAVGRIVRIRCDVVKGKLGQKVNVLLSTVNRALSAPSLPDASLNSTKAYVMIVPGIPPKSNTSVSKTKVSPRHPPERIVGCVIVSRIAKAMRVLDAHELETSTIPKSDLVCVDIDDSNGNVYCDPTLIPATLGIPRLFVVPSHRRQGIAQKLLDAAAKTAIWGCPLDPASGQIAFSQPTASGRAVMKSWGGQDIRIYNEH